MSMRSLSLRDEIENYFGSYFQGQAEYECDIPEIVSDILKLFEKKIDSMFRTILEDVSKDMTKEEMNYIEPRFLTVFEKQKKEILK